LTDAFFPNAIQGNVLRLHAEDRCRCGDYRGWGQAGAQCAISLRQHGWPGAIVTIAAEEILPYQRPPLSKAYLAGEMAAERLLLREQGFYDAQRIEMRLGESVTALDRRDNVVVTSEGAVVPFAKLFLATGTRPRKLAMPGIHLDGIGYLRNIEDVRRLQPDFQAKDTVREVSMLKAYACETLQEVVHGCLQLHGGTGFVIGPRSSAWPAMPAF
jgi:NADPH-dependent 2,4-dienoyl-CoA reductase/sulfur reductase-like enzyme